MWTIMAILYKPVAKKTIATNHKKARDFDEDSIIKDRRPAQGFMWKRHRQPHHN